MSGAATDLSMDAHASRVARLNGLYAVTPDEPDPARLLALAAAALDGGARVLQLRDKTADAARRRELARGLVALARPRGALVIVNDDAALARDADADGVHVGVDDLGVEAARAIVGPARLVGASCYDDLARARAAVAAGADHVAFGSFFASSTKPHARRAPLALIGRARALGVPVVAIGGIDERNVGELVEAGVDAVAVIGAVFGAGDTDAVRMAARRIASHFEATAR